jgi:GTP-binding protein
MIKITNAKFITSAASKSQFIESEKPIIAVCGKSNVGKSSFINMLAGQRKLARVSQEPGRTRLINYFDFGAFILADLPGYGYAKVSKAEKAKWAKMLDDFFAEKEKIAHVFSLCDIRHDPTEDDKTMVNFLYYHLIPFTVVATKADKLSKNKINASIANIAAIYKGGAGDIIATSSQTKQGLDIVLQAIEKIISLQNQVPDDTEE